jgi:DNA-binding IclR family transcriptional regulator
MYDMHGGGCEPTIASLSRALGVPRATVQRRLTILTKKEFVVRKGARYALCAEPFNEPARMEGFRRRVSMLRGATLRLFELGALD